MLLLWKDQEITSLKQLVSQLQQQQQRFTRHDVKVVVKQAVGWSGSRCHYREVRNVLAKKRFSLNWRDWRTSKGMIARYKSSINLFSLSDDFLRLPDDWPYLIPPEEQEGVITRILPSAFLPSFGVWIQKRRRRDEWDHAKMMLDFSDLQKIYWSPYQDNRMEMTMCCYTWLQSRSNPRVIRGPWSWLLLTRVKLEAWGLLIVELIIALVRIVFLSGVPPFSSLGFYFWHP